jgi:ABC-2 type transport system ATP-binding protein
MTTNETWSVEAVGLTKRYRADDRAAVDGLTLRVRPGEFFGFLGPNGAGKSTTIKMLTGLLRPTAGTIRVAGVDVAADPLEVKARIGILPEEGRLYERLSAFEFLEFAGQMHGLSRSESRRRADDLLGLLDLSDAADRLIVDYSMGMRKKTALAAALIHAPRVLFLDEPFNGVDPISVRVLCEALRHITEARGTTVFFTSHVLDVVERLCSRVAVIHQGRLAAEGTVAELRARAETGGDATLEDVFLRLVGARTEVAALGWL